MAGTERTRIVGLTGGIGSGKSAVGGMLRALGAEVIDADQVARDVVRPGQPALADIVAAFGAEVLLPDGTLDRKRLGARVFADEKARRTLNAITHPRIGMATAERLGEVSARGVPVAVYEATLVVENGLHEGFDGLIVVAVSPATQVLRAAARDGLTADEVRARIAAQAPLAAKLAAANWVIDNDGPLDDTRRQVESVWRDLRAGRKPERGTSAAANLDGAAPVTERSDGERE